VKFIALIFALLGSAVAQQTVSHTIDVAGQRVRIEVPSSWRAFRPIQPNSSLVAKWIVLDNSRSLSLYRDSLPKGQTSETIRDEQLLKMFDAANWLRDVPSVFSTKYRSGAAFGAILNIRFNVATVFERIHVVSKGNSVYRLLGTAHEIRFAREIELFKIETRRTFATFSVQEIR